MVSGPVTSVARVEDVQIFLKDPVYIARAMNRTPSPSTVLPIEQSFNLMATEQF